MKQRRIARRHLLRAMLATGLTGSNLATLRANPLRPFVKPSLLDVLDPTAQFTMLGDTDHRDISIQCFAAREETIRALQSIDTQCIFLERPQELQWIADDLAAGRMTKGCFIDTMSHMSVCFFGDAKQSEESFAYVADTILHGKTCGISVFFLDINQALTRPSDPELVAYEREVMAALHTAQSKAPYFSSLSEDDQFEFGIRVGTAYEASLSFERRTHIKELFSRERFQDDEKIARAAQVIAGRKKGTFFFGAQHGIGFERQLGGVGFRKIALAGAMPIRPEVFASCSPHAWAYFSVATGLKLSRPPSVEPF